jgi:hypothetical protein
VHCLEETLSTLDYAHRAKSIKNRPEVIWLHFLSLQPLYSLFLCKSIGNLVILILQAMTEKANGKLVDILAVMFVIGYLIQMEMFLLDGMHFNMLK